MCGRLTVDFPFVSVVLVTSLLEELRTRNLIVIWKISIQSPIDPSEDALHQNAFARCNNKWITQVAFRQLKRLGKTRARTLTQWRGLFFQDQIIHRSTVGDSHVHVDWPAERVDQVAYSRLYAPRMPSPLSAAGAPFGHIFVGLPSRLLIVESVAYLGSNCKPSDMIWLSIEGSHGKSWDTCCRWITLVKLHE